MVGFDETDMKKSSYSAMKHSIAKKKKPPRARVLEVLLLINQTIM